MTYGVDDYNITHILDYNEILCPPRWFLWTAPLIAVLMTVLGLAGKILTIFHSTHAPHIVCSIITH